MAILTIGRGDKFGYKIDRYINVNDPEDVTYAATIFRYNPDHREVLTENGVQVNRPATPKAIWSRPNHATEDDARNAVRAMALSLGLGDDIPEMEEPGGSK